MVQTLLIPIAVLLLFLIAFVLFRAALFTSREEQVEAVPGIDVDSRTVAEHLGRLVRCETVARSDPEKLPRKAFRTLHKELEMMYPRVHRLLEMEAVSDHSLLFTWRGSNPELKPVLLMGHQDVVPAEIGGENGWEHPPFSGEIADGFVWGRGTLDDKLCLTGVLEAVECLLQEGFKPTRTVYLAFGHDEEIDGRQGAACIADLLRQRAVELEMVLDEGGMIISGILPGVERPVAVIGIAEKGALLIELTSDAPVGHASAPPAQTAIGRLARAIARVEAHPMAARLKWFQLMFRPLASELNLGMRILLANTWLFGGILKRRLSASTSTNAMVRTTIAPTMLKGGIKENVLPGHASVAFDARLMPGDSLPQVFEHIRKVAGKDGIQVHNLYPDQSGPAGFGAREASPVTNPDGPAFQVLAWTIRQVFTDCLVAPYLVTGATDSRYFTGLCSQVLRFTPVRFGKDDIARVHGVNERLSVKACGDLVRFYRQLLLNAAG